jgi:hypothetical protein
VGLREEGPSCSQFQLYRVRYKLVRWKLLVPSAWCLRAYRISSSKRGSFYPSQDTTQPHPPPRPTRPSFTQAFGAALPSSPFLHPYHHSASGMLLLLPLLDHALSRSTFMAIPHRHSATTFPYHRASFTPPPRRHGVLFTAWSPSLLRV